LWIAVDLYGANGLSNHAAAGAYGFLLSAAPAMLIISFFISHAITSSPEAAAAFFQQSGILEESFDIVSLIETFLASSRPGITGIISAVSILWAARICALSIQRGIGVIFPDTRKIKPLRMLVTALLLELLIIIFIFTTVLGSNIAMVIYNALGFLPRDISYSGYLDFTARAVPFVVLGIMTFAAYMLAPSPRPTVSEAVRGVLFCVILYGIFSFGFALIINPARYNLLYGALGQLLLFLVNVYFFFTFFFFGAQITHVLHSFDALFFIRFRYYHADKQNSGKLWNRFLFADGGFLANRVKQFKSGEVVISREERGREVFYILSGEAGVYLDDGLKNRLALIGKGEFFGEMKYLLSEERSAVVTAETDLSVIALTPEIFNSILKTDPETDRRLIKILSERLRNSDQQIIRNQGGQGPQGNAGEDRP
jgi:membrane protein